MFPVQTHHFDPFEDGGGYPRDFMAMMCRTLRAEPESILHVCSGSVRSGLTVDIRPETTPRVVADGRALPFADESFRAVAIDPPYSPEWAANLYGTTYPRPLHLLLEADRVLVLGGRCGLMHWLVPYNGRCRMKLTEVHGITQGPGYRIKAWTVFEKPVEHPELFECARD